MFQGMPDVLYHADIFFFFCSLFPLVTSKELLVIIDFPKKKKKKKKRSWFVQFCVCVCVSVEFKWNDIHRRGYQICATGDLTTMLWNYVSGLDTPYDGNGCPPQRAEEDNYRETIEKCDSSGMDATRRKDKDR